MSREGEEPSGGLSGDGVDVEDLLDQLEELEETITTSEQRKEFNQTKRMLKRLPGSKRIEKYTTRDMGEALVGSIIFALPLLVEDGVFAIADHLFEFLIAGIPVFFLMNVVFVIGLATGLIYAVDIREVKVVSPVFGVMPRRLVGILTISFLATAGLMLMWGRVFEEDPTTLTALGRITVIWAAAALGASLGDILPGESKGTDLTLDNIGDIIVEN